MKIVVYVTCTMWVLQWLSTWDAIEASDTNVSHVENKSSSLIEEDRVDEDDTSRLKREGAQAGSGLGGILSAIFNKKLGLFGSLSSSSTGVSSSSSSKGVEEHHETPAHPVKPFDWWTFKKTILASLLQAVKAITGGVIVLNGQLVKVKGHLLTAKGHLLANKGDAISAFGRHITTNAFGQPEVHHEIHEQPIIHGGPSAPASLPSSAGFPSAPDFGAIGPSSTYGGNLVPGFGNEYVSAVELPAGFYGGGHNSGGHNSGSGHYKRASAVVPAASQKSAVAATNGNVYTPKERNVRGARPSVPIASYARRDIEGNEQEQNVEYMPISDSMQFNVQRQLQSQPEDDYARRLSFQMNRPYNLV